MADIWDADLTLSLDGDSLRICSRANPDLWFWWCPLLSIGGSVPWNIWEGKEVPLDAVRQTITEYLQCAQGPA